MFESDAAEGAPSASLHHQSFLSSPFTLAVYCRGLNYGIHHAYIHGDDFTSLVVLWTPIGIADPAQVISNFVIFLGLAIT